MKSISHHAMIVTATIHPLRERWDRFSRSPFFAASFLAHLLLVLLLGGRALLTEREDDLETFSSSERIVVANDQPAVPPPSRATTLAPQFQVPVSAVSAQPAAIISSANRAVGYALPQSLTAPKSITPSSSLPSLPGTLVSQKPTPTARADIKAFIEGWALGSTAAPLNQRGFKFTAYVAKYAGGDWASTSWRKGEQITGGSLVNLLYVIKTQSRDRIEAAADPVALDLASEKLFLIRPPFIFFTGHRDFQLTAREVENLQRYVRLGGCIWGDSSLPGQRSRFDLAFRREMKRVIPDLDKPFQPLPESHDLFKTAYYPGITGPPAGLNNYRESVYAIHSGGAIAILYTANDYADMWQIGLDSRWQIDTRRDENGRFVALNPTFWENRNTYFRGLEPEKITTAFKFGTNVVLHLLTRWESNATQF